MVVCWRGIHRCISKRVCFDFSQQSRDEMAEAISPTEEEFSSIDFHFESARNEQTTAACRCRLLHVLVCVDDDEILNDYLEHTPGISRPPIAISLLDYCASKMHTPGDTACFSCDVRFLSPRFRPVVASDRMHITMRLDRFCQEIDALPAFFANLPLRWRLRKRRLSVGHGSTLGRVREVTYKLIDIVIPEQAYSMQVATSAIPLVDDLQSTITLGNGELCEALEFTLPTMASGERARVFSSWGLLTTRPPTALEPFLSAVPLTSLKGIVELVIEVVNVVDVDHTHHEQLLEHEIAWARERLHVCTNLCAERRFTMALSIYHEIQKLFDGYATDEAQGQALTVVAAILKTCELHIVQCYLHLQACTLALGICNAALSSDATDTKWLYLRARCLLGMKNFKEAHQCVKSIFKFEPASKAANDLMDEIVKKRHAYVAHEKHRLAFALREACKEEDWSTGRDAGRLEDKTNLEEAIEEQMYSQIVANGWEPDPRMPIEEKLSKFCKPEVVDFFKSYNREREQKDLMEQWGISREEAAVVQGRGHL